MAVYRRTYASYTGPLTPGWSRWFVLFRYARQNLFRSKFQTALFVASLFLSARVPGDDLPRSQSGVSAADRRAQPGAGHRQQILFLFHECARSAGLRFDCVRRPRPDLTRPRQRRVASLFLPPAFSPRIRSRKSIRPRNSSLADHMDSRTGSVPRASHACRTRMDLGSPLDRRQHHRLIPDLDFSPLAPRDGTLRVGEMADRRWRPAISHAVFRSRLRARQSMLSCARRPAISSTSPI